MNNNNNQNNPNEFRVGLWNKVSPKGTHYLQGRLDGKSFAIFPNLKKRTPNSPDFTLIINDREAQQLANDTQQASGFPQAPQGQVNNYAPQQTQLQDMLAEDDDMPF